MESLISHLVSSDITSKGSKMWVVAQPDVHRGNKRGGMGVAEQWGRSPCSSGRQALCQDPVFTAQSCLPGTGRWNTTLASTGWGFHVCVGVGKLGVLERSVCSVV